MDKTVVEIYRDCLRMAQIVGLKTGNSVALRKQVRAQFKRNVHVHDPKEVEKLKDKQVNPRFKEKSYEEQEQEYEARVRAKTDLYKQKQNTQNKPSS